MIRNACFQISNWATAQENGGVALGKKRFLDATGIAESDWSGRYWTRWSDAVAEAADM